MITLKKVEMMKKINEVYGTAAKYGMSLWIVYEWWNNTPRDTAEAISVSTCAISANAVVRANEEKWKRPYDAPDKVYPAKYFTFLYKVRKAKAKTS